jgi:hypothetical protein
MSKTSRATLPAALIFSISSGVFGSITHGMSCRLLFLGWACVCGYEVMTYMYIYIYIWAKVLSEWWVSCLMKNATFAMMIIQCHHSTDQYGTWKGQTYMTKLCIHTKPSSL